MSDIHTIRIDYDEVDLWKPHDEVWQLVLRGRPDGQSAYHRLPRAAAVELYAVLRNQLQRCGAIAPNGQTLDEMEFDQYVAESYEDGLRIVDEARQPASDALDEPEAGQ